MTEQKRDGLREEVERRMRADVTDYSLTSMPGVRFVPHDAAVDLAVALLREERRRWGHKMNCMCWKDRGSANPGSGPDPGCAPVEEA